MEFLLVANGNISGLQAMIDSCHKFASKRNLKFGTDENPENSKTKAGVIKKNILTYKVNYKFAFWLYS